MRILFVSYAEKTHYFAMVPLAWAFVAAGHQVQVASQPAMADAITASGLPAVPLGADHRMWESLDRLRNHPRAADRPAVARIIERARNEDLPDFALARSDVEVPVDDVHRGYERLVEIYRGANETFLRELVDYAVRWRPQLVVWEPMTYAAPLAARACGAEHGRLLWSLDAAGALRARFHGAPDAAAGRDPLREWLETWCREFALPFTEDLVTGSFTIDHYPPGIRLDAGLDYLPMQYAPYGGRATVPAWLEHPTDRPRVALTLGISALEHFGDYAVDVVALLTALAALEVEVVATLPERLLGEAPLPGNVRVVSEVPLDALLPTCAAVVHHGGFGTVNTAIRHALPQLVLPQNDDAPLIGSRLQAWGAGLSIPMADAHADAVGIATRRLLTEGSFTARAEALRGAVTALPTPAEQVGILERRVAGAEFSGTGVTVGT